MEITAGYVGRLEMAPPDASNSVDAALVARFSRHLSAHLQALQEVHAQLGAVATAAGLISRALASGGRVFTCGNGGSAAEAEHFAAELVGRFRYDRRALAACSLASDSAALTAIANDYGYADVFARQLEALAGRGDVLVAISTSGESENVGRAASVARHRDLGIIAMTGAGKCSLSRRADVALHAPSSDTPIIQEAHMLFTHLLCDAVERQLCPSGATS